MFRQSELARVYTATSADAHPRSTVTKSYLMAFYHIDRFATNSQVSDNAS
jgi:hypothetical protein